MAPRLTKIAVRPTNAHIVARLQERGRSAAPDEIMRSGPPTVIVIDTSAMVGEGPRRSRQQAKFLDALSETWTPLTSWMSRVLSVLRGLELGHKLAPAIAEQARHDCFAFTITCGWPFADDRVSPSVHRFAGGSCRSD